MKSRYKKETYVLFTISFIILLIIGVIPNRTTTGSVNNAYKKEAPSLLAKDLNSESTSHIKERFSLKMAEEEPFLISDISLNQTPSDTSMDKEEIQHDSEGLNPVQQPYSGIIQRLGNVPDSRLQSIESYYSMIPQNIRTLLETAGWQFVCSSENIGTSYGYTHSVLALTVYEDKIIYIANEDVAESAILHEVGHAFDAAEGFISGNSSEFTAIFDAEVQQFRTVHSTHQNNTESADEYFAEAFQVLMESPELLQTNCPMTYDYIMRYISNI